MGYRNATGFVACVYLVIFSILVTHVLPPMAYAPPPASEEDSKPVSVPVHDFNEENAKQWSDKLIAQVNSLPGKRSNHRVRILHLGNELSPGLRRLTKNLSDAGIVIEGTVLSEERFDEAINKIQNEFPSQTTIDQAIYQEERRSLTRKAFDFLKATCSPLKILSRLNNLKNKIFGLPDRGVTFIQHVYSTNDEGKLERRFNAWNWIKMAVPSTLISNVIFSSTLLANNMSPTDSHFIAANLVLGLFVFSSVSFSQEINSFKMQGTSAYWDDSLEKDEQFVHDAERANSKSFFTLSSLGQELVLLAFLLPALLGISNISWTDVGMGVLNGVFSVYSYLFPAQILGQFLKKQESLENEGKTQEAKKWGRNGLIFSFAWFSVVYPIIKFSHLLFTGDLSTGGEWLAFIPLTIAGTVGMVSQIVQSRKQIMQGVRNFFGSFKKQKRNCEFALQIQAIPPQADSID